MNLLDRGYPALSFLLQPDRGPTLPVRWMPTSRYWTRIVPRQPGVSALLRRRWLRPDLVAKLMAPVPSSSASCISSTTTLPALTVPGSAGVHHLTPIYVTPDPRPAGRALQACLSVGPCWRCWGGRHPFLDGLTESYALGFLVVVQGANVCFCPGPGGLGCCWPREAEQPPQLARFGCFYLSRRPGDRPARLVAAGQTSISRQPPAMGHPCSGWGSGHPGSATLSGNKGNPGQQRRAGHHEQRP